MSNGNKNKVTQRTGQGPLQSKATPWCGGKSSLCQETGKNFSCRRKINPLKPPSFSFWVIGPIFPCFRAIFVHSNPFWGQKVKSFGASRTFTLVPLVFLHLYNKSITCSLHPESTFETSKWVCIPWLTYTPTFICKDCWPKILQLFFLHSRVGSMIDIFVKS